MLLQVLQVSVSVEKCCGEVKRVLEGLKSVLCKQRAGRDCVLHKGSATCGKIMLINGKFK